MSSFKSIVDKLNDDNIVDVLTEQILLDRVRDTNDGKGVLATVMSKPWFLDEFKNLQTILSSISKDELRSRVCNCIINGKGISSII